MTDEEIIAAALTHRTNAGAAAAVGLSRNAYYRRISRPEFREKLQAARTELIRSACNAAQSRAQGAIETIGAIMEDGDTPPQVRLNAADALLRHTIKLSELADFADRLAALEDAVGRG